jgi:serine/threonine-protein kinase
MRSEKQPVRSSASQPPFPEKVGAYELLLPIASGGMGTVYLARKRGPGGFEREVALKLTHAFLREQPEWAAELIEEAKLAARIRHTNVVQVMDVEDDPYGVFLVMQYVEGESLEGLLRLARERGERIPVDVGLRILLDALGGLHAAHELRDPSGEPLGLVHRDFTPQNILVGTDGIARLTDFGVAKAASRDGVTRAGVVKGKAPYMAPEQVRSMPLDRRADVWAAGVVAWELFAGRRMRPSVDDQAALLLQVATEAPPRLLSAREDAPIAVDEAVAQALTLDRSRRCSSAVRFGELLAAAWADTTAPAEASAVAQYVRAAAGEALAERRDRAAGVVASRASSAASAAVAATRRRVRPLLALGGAAAIAGAVWIETRLVRDARGSAIATPVSASAPPPAAASSPTPAVQASSDDSRDGIRPAPSPRPAESANEDSRAAAVPAAATAPPSHGNQVAAHVQPAPRAPGSVEPPLAKNPYE